MVLSRLFFIIAAISFLSVSAKAQPAPCSAGIQDPPIFSVVLDSPVRLSFRSTTQAILFQPEVTIAGNEIAVVQLASGANQSAFPDCNRQSVSLGDLPPGSYTVTWNYQPGESSGGSPIFFATFSFHFTVPAAVPCALGLNIQPRSPAAGQPVSIIYSVPFRGFLQTPAVAIDGSQITIDQPAAIADPAFPGHVPCARGVVQISSLRADYYAVAVRSNAPAPLSDAFIVGPATRGRAVRGH